MAQPLLLSPVMRGHDRMRVAGLFAFFFLVIAAFWLQKPLRTSRFLAHVGPEQLPLVKFGTALLIVPVVLAYSMVAGWLRRASLVYVCTIFFAACTLGFWSFFSTHAAVWVDYAYFFYVDIFNSVMVVLFWSFANDLSTAEEAQRNYGVIGAGGILGGAFGSAVTGWMVERVGAPNLLLVCIVFFAAIALIAGLLTATAPAEATHRGHAKPEASLGDAVAGARLTLDSRYLQAIAAMVLLYEICSNVIDFQFNTFVAARYGHADQMASFLGRFSTASIVASLVVQFALTTWILRRWGPRVGLLILPLALALGSASFLAVPVFALVAAVFFSDASLSYSLNQATKEVLYTPTDEASKYQAKAFIDMFLMRFGKGLSALLILAWLWYLKPIGFDLNTLSVVAIAATVLWLVVARYAAREFDRLIASESGSAKRKPFTAAAVDARSAAVALPSRR